MDPPSVKHRLTCILAADAVGYSRLVSEDEGGALRVLAAHRAVIDGIIGFHDGRIVSASGDSVLAEFRSVVDAVRCAVEIQDALKTRNEALAESQRMLFRIGINLGEVVVKGDDLLGDGVNVASRLEGLAQPGGILISSSVYDQITGKLDLGFQDMGEQALKNIARPIRAFRVSSAGGTIHAQSAPPATTATKRSGALPVAIAALALGVVAGVAWLQGWIGSRQAEVRIAEVDPAKARLESDLAASEKARDEAERRVRTAAADAIKARGEAEVAMLRAKAEADAASLKGKAQAEAAAMRSQAAQAQEASRAKAADADARRARAEADVVALREKAESEAAALRVKSETDAAAAKAKAQAELASRGDRDEKIKPCSGRVDGVTGDCTSAGAQAQPAAMTFFVSSVGSGKGADYGGLAGADKHCQTLATAAGAGSHTWHAYLSTTAASGSPAVNARDRIGAGPWQNAKGVIVAHNVAELHGSNNLTKQTALTEKGDVVNGRGDTPNRHDILTGSQADGTAFAGSDDATCGNWTKSGDGAAQLGHHDRVGLNDDKAWRSWNSSHFSRSCSDDGLRSTGGAGLLYCFAAK